ncbi:sensor histidine kinase [Sphingomonas sp. PAMC 26617]|uniref:sensor histidine kinase n=1 Tax=Sphingomonas sp. PAMC 26617 TaxID=1112216 RepID=UPI00049616F5|nr:HAMP domain-containing sensor histidine kinase [Sphingomonas sp. PAMC 26617]
MPERRSSAAYRIAFTYSAGFALLVAVLGAIVFLAADRSFRQQQDAAIAEESASLLRDYRDEGLGDLRERIDAREASHPTNSFSYALFDGAGKRIAGGLNTKPKGSGWHDIVFVDPEEGADPARALATNLPENITLMVAADTEALERIDHTILVLFGGAFVLVLTAGAAGALILGGYLRHRLGRISGTARTVMAGDFSQRMPVSARNDEFDAVSASLNAMLDRIALLLENLQQVSSDLAHDLRTPLVRMRNGLERALADDAPRGTQQTAIQAALRESDDLLDLFAAILRISEVEGGELIKSFAPVDLVALVQDVCESCEPAIVDGGRTLRCTIEGSVLIAADRELLAQAIINLLENAQIHTPTGTKITIEMVHDEASASIIVSDNGTGVAVADHDRILRRFVRLDASRTTPGNGLGLNLVSAIVMLHGGGVTLSDNAPGLRVTINLPRLLER